MSPFHVSVWLFCSNFHVYVAACRDNYVVYNSLAIERVLSLVLVCVVPVQSVPGVGTAIQVYI